MTQITRSLYLEAPPEEIWKVVGSFQALVDWHPAVESSALEIIDGVEHRRLGLVGGGEILERSLGNDSFSYGYEIVTGSLPVSDYRSILALSAAGSGAVLVWGATFTAAGPDAEAVVGEVYESGFSALAERFQS